MDDLLNEFLTETTEMLAKVDVELVRFDMDSNDQDWHGGRPGVRHGGDRGQAGGRRGKRIAPQGICWSNMTASSTTC